MGNKWEEVLECYAEARESIKHYSKTKDICIGYVLRFQIIVIILMCFSLGVYFRKLPIFFTWLFIGSLILYLEIFTRKKQNVKEKESEFKFNVENIKLMKNLIDKLILLDKIVNFYIYFGVFLMWSILYALGISDNLFIFYVVLAIPILNVVFPIIDSYVSQKYSSKITGTGKDNQITNDKKDLTGKHDHQQTKQIEIYLLDGNSTKDYLFIRTTDSEHWEKYFFCLQETSLYFFRDNKLTSPSLGVIDINLIVSAEAVTSEVLEENGILTAEDATRLGEKDKDSFFQLLSKSSQEHLYFKTTKIPREKWINDFNFLLSNAAVPVITRDRTYTEIIKSTLEDFHQSMPTTKEFLSRVASTRLPKILEQDYVENNIDRCISVEKVIEFASKTGWMMKKGQVGLGYRRRYFVLHKVHRVLYYFSKDSGANASGIIHLWKGVCISHTSDTTFTIHDIIVSRDYFIATTTPHEKNGWIEVIKACLEENKMDSSHHSTEIV